MPLDGHAYLVAQGWGGKGTGLRTGAIARPVTVAQKKTLSGVGKDRDDAFPFWDHVFEAAAINIQVKLNQDEDSDGAVTPELNVELQRTSTGIISNRRPKTGAPALSGTITPDAQVSGSSTPRLSVMAVAKQEAARRILYSNFFRGPVLGFNDDKSISSATIPDPLRAGGCFEVPPETHDSKPELLKEKKKRREQEDRSRSPSDHQDKKKRKRSKEKKEKDGALKEEKKRRKRDYTKEAPDNSVVLHSAHLNQGQEAKRIEKAEKKRRKEEKRASKGKRRKLDREFESEDQWSAAQVWEGGEAGEERQDLDGTLARTLASDVTAKKSRKREKTSDESIPEKIKKQSRKEI